MTEKANLAECNWKHHLIAMVENKDSEHQLEFWRLDVSTVSNKDIAYKLDLTVE